MENAPADGRVPRLDLRGYCALVLAVVVQAAVQTVAAVQAVADPVVAEAVQAVELEDLL